MRNEPSAVPTAPYTESVCVHDIEPSLQGPLPRRFRLSPSVIALLVCAALLWAACVGIGLAALLGVAKLVWLDWRGKTAQARVVAVLFEDGRQGPATLEPLSQITGMIYGYRTSDGQYIHTVGAITPAQPDREEASLDVPRAPDRETLKAQRLAQIRWLVRPGRSWAVRYASWGGGVICEPWPQPVPAKLLFLLVVGCGALVSGSYCAVRLARWLSVRVRLLRRGVATVGTILHTRSNADDAAKYFVCYGYAGRGTAYQREERCHPDQWRCFQVGESVTVLYDPDHPAQAAMFRLLVIGRPG